MRNLLPEWLFEKISNQYLLDYLTEIRVRINKPIVVCYKGRYEILQDRNGYAYKTIIGDSDLLSYIITVATKQSFYAFSNQIKHGYITTDSGIRIGVCGEGVVSDGNISTLKNISSINIRIAHKVAGCSSKVLDIICKNGYVKNTLIISPPGAGKTTFIRDLAESLVNEKGVGNILVVDERYEIAGNVVKSNLLKGDFIDVVSGVHKQYAFNETLKTMNPSVIVADEISEVNDIEGILEASRCGVKVIATAHAGNIEDLKRRPSFEKLLDAKVFERIVVLSKRFGIGTIEAVFDENLRGIYLPIEIWNICY